MAIDTGARSHGRAVSRIGPTPRAQGRTPAARTLQYRARDATLGSLASGGSKSAGKTLSRRKQSVSQALSRVMKSYKGTNAPGLDSSQQKILHTLLNVGTHMGASKSDKLSAVETGLVESNLSNPSGGDGSSVGWRQETASSYPGVNRMNVKQGAKRFYSELKSAPAGSPGQRAQAVQRSAYPDRYDQQAGQAKQLLQGSTAKPANPKDLKTLQKAGVGVQGPKAARPASKEVVNRFQAIKHAANTLTKGKVPYVWGGGHGGFSNPSGGLDCSGAVSAVLHSAGVLNTPLTSGAMGQVLKPGPGAVTVYYNQGHTFMKIGNRYWGTSVGDSGSGGLGNHPAPSGSYLNEYSVGHVPGLGKKAAEGLGVKLSGGGGGITTGGGGGTASISGGSIQTTPGFSKNPIKTLTSKQKQAKVNAIYRSGGTSSTPSAGTGSLGSRYGHPAV